MPPASTASASSSRTHFDVIVVGAGFSGIGAAIRLRQAGFDFIVLEKASEPGGVWRDNVYPDCACDVPSSFYSYSFAPKADWSHFFAQQDEIREYALETAAAFGVTDAIRCNTELLAARWRPAANQWELETTAGVYTCGFVIMAPGPMHQPVIPRIPGMDSFEGERFHSARWNHAVDLTDKDVAVVGTGASAIQFVPPIQKRVRSLTVFQRTAPWVLPKFDPAIPPVWQERFRRYPFLQRLLRRTLYAQFEFLNWSLSYPRLRRRLETAALKNAFRSVKDPGLRERVRPDYAIGCKRILQSNKWYRALAADNVRVLGGVREVDGKTVVATDGTRAEADVVIFATGFQVANPPIAERIFGESGASLAEVWAGSPQAYLGTTVADCPNCFIVLGPNLYAFSSAFVMIEAQLGYILSALEEARKLDLVRLALRPGPLATYNEQLQSSLDGTVFNRGGCTSYFIDRNGRNSTNWPWTTLTMRARLRRVALADYETATSGPEP